jgi:uncharacterized membrane protein
MDDKASQKGGLKLNKGVQGGGLGQDTPSVCKKQLTFQRYLLTAAVSWFWIINSINTVTVVMVFVPDGPVQIIRHVCGSLVVLCLPGFALLKVAIPEQQISSISRLALSVGISIGLTSIVVAPLLFLLPSLTSELVTLLLTALTLALSVIAVKLEYNTYLENFKAEVIPSSSRT